MDYIALVHRFIASGWKDLDTCVRIHVAINTLRSRYAESAPQWHDLNAISHQLEHYTYAIANQCTKYCPLLRDADRHLLPRVAWLPPKQYDEETGLPTTAPPPPIPIFASPRDLNAYLKQQADAALEADSQQ